MVKVEEGQFVNIDGIKTFYIKKGKGHPVLLIHGGAPGACTFVSWRSNIDWLANNGFAVYAFDQPGFGKTDNADDFSMEYRYRHTKAFIEKMGLERFHMVANSQGAYIAFKIALEDERTGRLVSTGSGTVAPKGSAESQAQAKVHGEQLREYKPSRENIKNMTMKTLFNKELVDDDLVETRFQMSIGKNYEAQLKRKKAAPPEPIIEELPTLKTKTLLIWGANDHGVAIERGLLLFQLIPDAEFHVFNQCGHWCQWDQKDRFHAIVNSFLKDSV